MQPLQIRAPDKPHQEETVSKNQHWIYHIVNKKSITRDAVTHDELRGVSSHWIQCTAQDVAICDPCDKTCPDYKLLWLVKIHSISLLHKLY